MRAANLHRGCRKTVPGKDAGDGRTFSKTHKQQIPAAGLTDAGAGGTEFHPFHRENHPGVRAL